VGSQAAVVDLIVVIRTVSSSSERVEPPDELSDASTLAVSRWLTEAS
jgi:hypothetical protein